MPLSPRPFFALVALATVAAAPGELTVPFKRTDGAAAGSVTLREGRGGVLLRVDAAGLTPGWHAIHFHEKATCADPGFKASGGHVHAAKTAVHGLLNRSGNDQGDLPNIYADVNGKARAELFTTFASLEGGSGRAKLRDADGSAIIVHDAADDHMTQPIGGAGDRVACAVVR